MKTYQNYKRNDIEIGKITPKGWLKDQLTLQMKGITGDLDENWGSVGAYADWIGGTDTSWERPPYWLDGLVPLSYLLRDEKGMEKAEKWVRWSLDSQRENGDFGPTYNRTDFDSTLFWPKFVMLKVMVSYYEVRPQQEILDFMTKYFRFCLGILDTYELSGWDQAREGDFAFSIYWLYEKTGEEFLLELAEKAGKQSLGWTDCFENFPFTRPTGFYYKWDKVFPEVNRKDLYDVMQYHMTHVVNVAMGLKTPVMDYKYSGDSRCLDAIYAGLESLQKYHGQVAGVFAGDEHLNGTNPTQGSELCSVVELMFSLHLIYRQTGNPIFLDRLERIAYNALPATITEDFKGHQYDQQANQMKVTMEPRNWYNNGDRANLFGFEPNFGCCLANMHQGWPKFVKNAVFTDEEAVYFGIYMPIEAECEWNGQKVTIREETNYPFEGTVRILISGAEEGKIPCRLRIPQWCQAPQLKMNGKEIRIRDYDYAEVTVVVERGHETELILELPMELRLEEGWYHEGVSVAYGPLVMALNIKEQWTKLQHGHPDFPDYEIRPESPWNYALIKDSLSVVKKDGTLAKQAFSKMHAPIVVKAKGIRLDQWQEEGNSAGDLPFSPVSCAGETEEIELIPYGCTKLRISVFPWL